MNNYKLHMIFIVAIEVIYITGLILTKNRYMIIKILFYNLHNS